MMRKPQVQAALRRAMKERAMKLDARGEDVVRELMRIAYADPRDYMTWTATGLTLRDSSELTDDEARAIKGVTKRGSVTAVDLHDKITALHLLGKHLGVFPVQRVMVSPQGVEIGEGNEAIRIYLPDNGRQVALPEASSPGITRVLDAPTNGHHPVDVPADEDGATDDADLRP
jgi:hypothetical protein